MYFSHYHTAILVLSSNYFILMKQFIVMLRPPEIIPVISLQIIIASKYNSLLFSHHLRIQNHTKWRKHNTTPSLQVIVDVKKIKITQISIFSQSLIYSWPCRYAVASRFLQLHILEVLNRGNKAKVITIKINIQQLISTGE